MCLPPMLSRFLSPGLSLDASHFDRFHKPPGVLRDRIEITAGERFFSDEFTTDAYRTGASFDKFRHIAQRNGAGGH